MSNSLQSVLQRYAIRNIWGGAHEDDQIYIKSVRLSKGYGSYKYFYIKQARMELPDDHTLYHVYSLGSYMQYGVDKFHNILNKKSMVPNLWLSCKDLLLENGVFVWVIVSGRYIGFDNTYIMRNCNGETVLAIKDSALVRSWLLEPNKDVYVRIYNTINAANNVGYIKPEYDTHIVNTHEINSYLTWTQTVNTLISQHGSKVQVYYNGFLWYYDPNQPSSIHFPSISKLQDGDRWEYVVDHTIDVVDDMSYSDMKGYLSTTDLVQKVIFSTDRLLRGIYLDDIDFYILFRKSTNPDNIYAGASYMKLYPKDIRELTYQDYALNDDAILNLIYNLPEFKDIADTILLNDLRIIMYARNNKEYRMEVLDDHRILDLSYLPKSIRQQALTDVNANIDIWQADNLETSPLNKYLSTPMSTIFITSTTGVYSRYAVEDLLSKPYREADNVWRLPLISGNKGGKLITFDVLGKYNSIIEYDPYNFSHTPYDGRGIEIFIPKETTREDNNLDIHIPANEPSYTFMDDMEFFCYYEDSSQTTNFYKLQPDIDYILTESEEEGTYRIDFMTHVLDKDKYIRFANDVCISEITTTLDEMNNGYSLYGDMTYTHEIGMKYLYIWANNRYLIEGLDYYVLGDKFYPTVTFDEFSSGITFTVIYLGIPEDDFMHHNRSEYGFMIDNKISMNGEYNLYRWRHNILTVNGRWLSYDDVDREEYFRSISTESFQNGQPFGVVPYPIYTDDIKIDAVSKTRAEEEALDEKLSNYLDVIYEFTPPTDPITITSKYDLVSPVMAKIIDDIQDGTLVIDSADTDEHYISMKTLPYHVYLAYDPCNTDKDMRFIEIHPHWRYPAGTITRQQYNFLRKVNEYLLNNNVSGLHLYLQLSD